MSSFSEVKAALPKEIFIRDDPPLIIKSENFIYIENDKITIQFTGWAIVLLENGEFFLDSTDGG